jgi:hypothetical protein
MFPAVVVDFAADAPAAAEQRVLEACNAAIAAGRCERPGASGEPPRSRARVRTGSELEVRIELERFGEEGLDPVVRVLEFSPSDPDGERWRSVGLALATLVGEVVEEVARAVRSASVASTESTSGTAATVATAPLATSASGAEPTPPQATAPAASSIDAVVPRLPAEPENDEVSRAAAGPSPLERRQPAEFLAEAVARFGAAADEADDVEVGQHPMVGARVGGSHVAAADDEHSQGSHVRVLSKPAENRPHRGATWRRNSCAR